MEGLLELLNLPNHANYGQNYFDAIYQPNFGKPINIITPPRTAQLGVKFSLLTMCMASGAMENQPGAARHSILLHSWLEKVWRSLNA